MDRKEFVKVVQVLKATYCRPDFLPDDYALDVWYAFLKDLTYSMCSEAVKRYISIYNRVPTIADIRTMAYEISNADQNSLNALEAWNRVYKAICNGIYNAESEFDKLPSICKRIYGSPAAIKEMASMTLDAIQVSEKTKFLKMFNSMQARIKSESIVPQDLCLLTSQLSNAKYDSDSCIEQIVDDKNDNGSFELNV